MKNFTAIHLIEKIIEFISLTPDKEFWKIELQRQNPPRYYRLLQIKSLAYAFLPKETCYQTLSSQIKSVLKGDFIGNRTETDYKELIILMDEFTKRGKDEYDRIPDLQYNYSNLLDYKFKLNEIFSHNSGILEISYPYIFAYDLTDKASRELKKIPVIEEIDKYLALFIDPMQKSFSYKELIINYEYPNVDLWQIDAEWA